MRFIRKVLQLEFCLLKGRQVAVSVMRVLLKAFLCEWSERGKVEKQADLSAGSV